ncbi:MAG TPA: tryptophan halogenase family protein [Cellvibrionaceae bacterium]
MTITIVGGGTAGWLAAAMLSHQLSAELFTIQLVESSELGSIAIGESTVPPFVGLLRRLGIDEHDFVTRTDATYKLGIKFIDWQHQRQQYFHPFGVLGQNIGQHDFYQCWLRARAEGDGSALQDFSPCNIMAEQGRFFHPEQARNTPIGGASYALHVDALSVARYLGGYAKKRAVKTIDGLVTQVIQRDNGFIDHLMLEDGRKVAGDFFIDCSGFKALLIGQTLGSEFIDWRQYLPCDRAIAVKTTAIEPVLPYTTATAQKSGWGWRIPLSHNTGHGTVYASDFCSDSDAQSILMRSLDGKRVDEPRLIPFVTGHRREIWKHNCLSLGLASGFIEPLESTSIHLIARGVEFFLRYFPSTACKPALAREYNRRMIADYEEVRDFLMLHYCTTGRTDTPFWRYCQQLPVPDSLAERIALFRAQGGLRQGVDELFRATSWQSVFEGMGIRPEGYCPRINNLSFSDITTQMQAARQAIAGMVKTLPRHDDFL